MPTRLLVVLAGSLAVAGCTHDRAHPDSLRAWLESPPAHGPSQNAAPADRVRFLPCAAYDHRRDHAVFAPIVAELQAGDVVTYSMGIWETRWRLLTGHIEDITFRLFTYGHVAVVVEDPPGHRYLFTSETTTGAAREDLDDLAASDWEAWRLDQAERLDVPRLAEFARICQTHDHGWTGYDYAGLIGCGDRGLQPTTPAEIAHHYLCSTVVVAAYRYAGIALDAVREEGFGHICPPAVVVLSAGAVVGVPPAPAIAPVTPPVNHPGNVPVGAVAASNPPAASPVNTSQVPVAVMAVSVPPAVATPVHAP